MQAVGPGELNVVGLDAVAVGDLAFENGIRLHELSTKQATLEEAFLEMTGGSQEFQAQAPAGQAPPHVPPPHAPPPQAPWQGGNPSGGPA